MTTSEPPITQAQVDLIRESLDEGASPEGVAQSLQRMADLGEQKTMIVRRVAEDIAAGGPLPYGLH